MGSGGRAGALEDRRQVQSTAGRTADPAAGTSRPNEELPLDGCMPSQKTLNSPGEKSATQSLNPAVLHTEMNQAGRLFNSIPVRQRTSQWNNLIAQWTRPISIGTSAISLSKISSLDEPKNSTTANRSRAISLTLPVQWNSWYFFNTISLSPSKMMR